MKIGNTGIDSYDWLPFYTSSTLTPPTGFLATVASSSEIDLSWTLESGATSYDIYMNTTGTAPTSSTKPTVSGLSSTTSSYKKTGLSDTGSNLEYFDINLFLNTFSFLIPEINFPFPPIRSDNNSFVQFTPGIDANGEKKLFLVRI